MTPDDVVSIQVYLTDGALFPRMNAVYKAIFQRSAPNTNHRRGRCLVGPGHIEITATARK
jgi:enamine deaminase RidA (YjgF/YER057c/UK114 family)